MSELKFTVTLINSEDLRDCDVEKIIADAFYDKRDDNEIYFSDLRIEAVKE